LYPSMGKPKQSVLKTAKRDVITWTTKKLVIRIEFDQESGDFKSWSMTLHE